MSKYRIGIDCRLAGHQHAGIGRYVVELVKRVTAHTDIDWVVFYSHPSQITELFENTVPKHCHIVHTPVKHYTLREQVSLNAIFTQASLDLLHVPHFNIPVLYARPMVITIHDLLWHEHKGSHVTTLPAWQYWIKYGFYRYVTRVAVKKAKAIFVPTETVRSTLQRYFPQSETKITVTREGISTDLLLHAKRASQAKRATNQLLYVGSLYPHKNVEVVLRALAIKNNYTFIIVSSRTVFRRNIEKLAEQLKLGDRVSFRAGISDAELAQLYHQSAALVQPSISEGFGLTGLEALAFSSPVVASDIPVFHEVYEDAAIYFDPHSTESFLEALEELEKNSTLKRLAAAASSVIRKNNWDELAETTIHKYRELIQSDQ